MAGKCVHALLIGKVQLTNQNSQAHAWHVGKFGALHVLQSRKFYRYIPCYKESILQFEINNNNADERSVM